MSTNLENLSELLKNCLGINDLFSSKGGVYTYSQSSFILFYLVMMLKGIHAYKTMHKYAGKHHHVFGWQKAPSRTTIRRRFEQMPTVLQWLIPNIAIYCSSLDSCFKHTVGYVDKSIFRAKGGLWHKKHRLLNIVPHPSIDTAASWAKSAYHGWRFGYGLSLIVNELRFPISAWVDTASVKEHRFLDTLINYVKEQMLVVVGDDGYRKIQTIHNMWKSHQVFVITNALFESSSKLKNWYNAKMSKANFKSIYWKRKPSVEPTFALIKELFNLKKEGQLPYKGVTKVRAYLMMATLAIQLLMVLNHIRGNKLQSLTEFRTL